MSEQASGDVNQPTGATITPAPGEKSRADFRDIKCTLPAMEFGTVQWAAKRAGENHCALPLAEFMHGAILARVREVVRAEIARQLAGILPASRPRRRSHICAGKNGKLTNYATPAITNTLQTLNKIKILKTVDSFWTKNLKKL